ncbi:MAG: NAD-dependent epimerase/dehydratase family protein [Pseudolabrys sp.]
MSTVIVLGGGGFLAGHIERHYHNLGWRVVSIGRAAAASEAAAKHVWSLPHSKFAHLLAVEQPQLCVNAAGRASVPASMVEPLADFEASTLLSYKILDDLRRRSPSSAYIHLSSAAVYGDPASLPVHEDAACAPISPYGWHKRMSEMVLEEHTKLFALRAASLRIFSTYGAGLRRQVIWDLASRAIAEPNRPLVLQGQPDDSRDFVHGSDIAQAVQAVAERGPLHGECYNVAAGEETRMQDLAALVLRVLDRPAQIEFDGKRRPGNPRRWQADTARLRALGFSPRIGLEQGVLEVIGEINKADA